MKITEINKRILVKNVFKFFEMERRLGKSWYKTNLMKRTAVATGMSEAQVRNVMHQKTNDDIKTNQPVPNRQKLDQFDRGVIRRIVHETYQRNEFASLESITVAAQKAGLNVSRSTVHRAIIKLGFRFVRKGQGKRFVKERADIVAKRHSFLRDVRRAREDGRMIVYVDETWVNESHARKGEWTDCKLTNVSSVLEDRGGRCARVVPSGKGKRLIVLDAGCRDVGLLPSVGEVFVAKSDSGDYHSEMNHEHFFNWWKDVLLPSLPGPSTIVIDNASYHSLRTDDTKTPTTATRKTDIQTWLTDKGIHFGQDMIKPELLDLVRQNKPRPMYIVDQLAMEAGHMVLRLPPRHCELNPIEMVWGIMKDHVARNNKTFKLADVHVLFEEARGLITPAQWNRCEDHVISKVEDVLWQVDGVREDEQDPTIITFDELSDDDMTDDEDNDNDELDEDEPGLDCNGDGIGVPNGNDNRQVTYNDRLDDDNDMTDENDDVLCIRCERREPPAQVCKKRKRGVRKDVEWVFCEGCDGWLHVECLGENERVNEKMFFCITCKNLFKPQFNMAKSAKFLSKL